MKKQGILGGILLGFYLFLGGGVVALFADEVIPLTILHTNDVHSHYKPDRGPYRLGGIARLKTAIRRARAASVNSVLLDGGDWSEGQIYYNLDGGRTALEMLNDLGYDAAVVGNHDWLNGPGQLLNILRRVPQRRFQLLGANLDYSGFREGAELSRHINQTAILTAGPLRVGVIGICNIDTIYEYYFSPVHVTDPFSLVRRLAEQLKTRDHVDIVVVISHNGMQTDRILAGLAHVDVVVHAHDHVKIPQPITITRNNKTAYLVEAEKWGRYLGRLDLRIRRTNSALPPAVEMAQYQLIQIDETLPDDPIAATLVSNYEAELRSMYMAQEGDIYGAPVAESHITIDNATRESLYGNMLADAYREYTGADIAFEQINLTSDYFYPGGLRTADIMNSLAQIFNPFTGRMWTLYSMKMSGTTIQRLLNVIFMVQHIIPGGLPSVSGLHAVYDPRTPTASNLTSLSSMLGGTNQIQTELQNINSGGAVSPLRSMEIGGRALNPTRLYRVALPQGLMDSLAFLRRNLGFDLEIFDNQDRRVNLEYCGTQVDRGSGHNPAGACSIDTGVEDWRVLRTYTVAHSPLNAQTIPVGQRLQPLYADLGFYRHDVTLMRQGRSVHFTARVHNYGVTTSSSPRTLRIGVDRTPHNIVDDPNIEWVTAALTVPALAQGQSYVVQGDFQLPVALANVRRIPVTAHLNSDHAEVHIDDINPSNDSATLMMD